MSENRSESPPVKLSGFVIHLQMEPYLAQWLINTHGSDPVVFPKNSAENDILEVNLCKTPPFPIPNEPGEDTVPIAIPYFKYKEVRGKHYLPKSARKELRKCIRSRFVIELWTDLFRFGYIGKKKQDLIWAWMESHGIESTETNWNTIAKIYMRKRNAYQLRLWRERVKKG